jgi:DNA-binding GntR family transcriptional regulator
MNSNDVVLTRRYPVGAEPVDGGTSFRVWAPDRHSVDVILLNGVTSRMNEEDDGYFSCLVEGAKAGMTYRLHLAGNEDPLSDPASDATASEQTDSLSRLAYRAILKQIMDGELKPNHVVQEAKLATDLGFSRTPIREAIGRLEGEGYVVRKGRTVMVQELTISDYFEILHMRRLVECEAASLAAASGRINKAELVALRDQVETLANDAGVEDHWLLDCRLHDFIARASGSRLLAQTVTELRRRTLLFGLGRLPGRLTNGQAEHLALIDALLAGDPTVARDAMAKHLENMRSEVVRSFERLA